MTPDTMSLLKVAAAGAVWFGCLLNLLDRYFGHTYMVSGKPKMPDWVSHVGAWIGLLGATAVVVLEILSRA